MLPSLVRLEVGGVQWSGVVIDAEKGLVLTTSRELGASPLVSVVRPDGTVLTGWVRGRDDRRNLALVEVTPDGLTAAVLGDSEALSVGNELAVLGYPEDRPTRPLIVSAPVSGIRQDFETGVRYVETASLFRKGTQGGPLVNARGEVMAIRMSDEAAVEAGIPVLQGAYAITITSAKRVLPDLEAGVVQIIPRPGPNVGDPGSPPPLPSQYSGTVSLQGQAAPVGLRLYARLQKSGLPDLWFSVELQTAGQYAVVVGPLSGRYDQGTVEFWMDGLKAQQTVTWRASKFETLNLVFS